MQQAARLTMERRNGNLHVTITGSFPPDSATNLVEFLDKSYNGLGDIFVHTKMTTEIAPDARAAFSKRLRASSLPRERIYFTGEKGPAIAQEAGKAIVQKPAPGHECCDRCQNCSCREKKAA